ncbi:MAG: hypothetical protein NTY19_17525 [Planctomycetota bacterium]|nr:hypothetical protein [Planctomycetota bacterium]
MAPLIARRRTRRSLRSWILLQLIPLSLLGQSLLGQVTLQMPPGPSEPTSLLLRDGAPWKVWVAFDGYQLRDSPSDQAKKLLGSKPLEFLYPYQVAMLWPQQNPKFALLATTADGKTVGKLEGWCPFQYLTTNAALRVPGTKVYRKALFLDAEPNSVAFREDQEEATSPAGKRIKAINAGKKPIARFLTQPTEGAPGRQGLAHPGPLSSYFVFAETETFVLLGAPARFPSGDEAAAQNVFGWVDKRHVSRWNTREAVSWNTESLIPQEWHAFWRYRQAELDKAQVAADGASDASSPANSAVSPTDTDREGSIIAQYQANNPGKACPTKDDVKDIASKLLRAKGQVFKKPEDAYRYFTRNLGENDIAGKTFVTEGLRFLGNEDFRYPVVEWRPDDEDKFRYPGANRLVKIAVLANLAASPGNSPVTPGLENRLRAAGVDIELLKQAQFNQVYEEGYVGLYPLGAEGKVKQLRSCAMLREAEVRELSEVLDKLVGDAAAGLTPVDLAEVYRSLIAKLTGDPKVTTLKDAVLQRTGLELQSQISKLTAQDILKGLDPEQKLDAQRRLLELRDATNGRRREYYVAEVPQSLGPPVKLWKFRNEREEQRYFTNVGDDTHYFWIDVQTEMP